MSKQTLTPFVYHLMMNGDLTINFKDQATIPGVAYEMKTPTNLDLNFLGKRETRDPFMRLVKQSHHKDLSDRDVIIAGLGTEGATLAIVIAQEYKKDFIIMSDKEPKVRKLLRTKEAPEVILVTPFIATGRTAAFAIKTLREAGYKCDTVLSAFNLHTIIGREYLGAKSHFKIWGSHFALDYPCKVSSVLTPQIFLNTASNFLRNKPMLQKLPQLPENLYLYKQKLRNESNIYAIEGVLN